MRECTRGRNTAAARSEETHSSVAMCPWLLTSFLNCWLVSFPLLVFIRLIKAVSAVSVLLILILMSAKLAPPDWHLAALPAAPTAKRGFVPDAMMSLFCQCSSSADLSLRFTLSKQHQSLFLCFAGPRTSPLAGLFLIWSCLL